MEIANSKYQQRENFADLLEVINQISKKLFLNGLSLIELKHEGHKD